MIIARIKFVEVDIITDEVVEYEKILLTPFWVESDWQ